MQMFTLIYCQLYGLQCCMKGLLVHLFCFVFLYYIRKIECYRGELFTYQDFII